MQNSGRYGDEIATFARARLSADIGKLMESHTDSAQPDPIDAAVAASGALLTIANRSIAEALELFDLAQYATMTALESGPRSSRELAEQTEVSSGSLADALKTLTETGWIHTVPGAELRFELTPHGAQLVAQVAAKRRRALEAILEGMPRRDRIAVAFAFTAFAKAADADDAPRP
jgi:DNA-binding MarR family transcriptional regulator